MGDAGHGAIDSEEIITVKLRAGGLEGHGYAYTIGRGGRAVHALIEHDLAPLLAGRDADGHRGPVGPDVAAAALRRTRRARRRSPSPRWTSRCGTCAACASASRSTRCSARRRATIPAYGSGVDLPKPMDELLKQTEGFLARGLPGVKVKIGRRDPREDESRVAAVRKLIGDGVDLMVDANMAWTAEEALERGQRLEPFGFYWYEEPTIPEDVAGHARLARDARRADRGRREPAFASTSSSAMSPSARSTWCRSTR